MRTPTVGDYVKTVSDRFTGQWKGKVRRGSDLCNNMYLIEWSYCGGLPNDICTWVFNEDIKITRRLKPKFTKEID